MSTIFLSYSTKDKDFVKRLDESLRNYYSLFIDYSGISGGLEWENRIKQAIEQCEVFLIVVSENAEASEWVARETLYAESLKKPRVPILLSGALPFRLFHLQYVDFRGSFDGGMADLLTSLKPLAPPTLQANVSADSLIAAAVRSRLLGENARANDLIHQAQALDNSIAVPTSDFWSNLCQSSTVEFNPVGLRLVEENLKLAKDAHPYKGHDGYRWTLRLAGPEDILKSIDYVDYFLDQSFRTPRQTVRDWTSGFLISRTLYGCFDMTMHLWVRGEIALEIKYTTTLERHVEIPVVNES